MTGLLDTATDGPWMSLNSGNLLAASLASQDTCSTAVDSSDLPWGAAFCCYHTPRIPTSLRKPDSGTADSTDGSHLVHVLGHVGRFCTVSDLPSTHLDAKRKNSDRQHLTAGNLPRLLKPPRKRCEPCSQNFLVMSKETTLNNNAMFCLAARIQVGLPRGTLAVHLELAVDVHCDVGILGWLRQGVCRDYMGPGPYF